MAIDKVREHLRKWNRHNDIMEFEVSSATVELAAKALGTEEAKIAKSLTFRNDDTAVLVVATGDVKIDNSKFKSEFGFKAKMLKFEEVENMIGHAVGGVCPFGINENVEVFLDRSLERFEEVFPACGSSNSAIKLSLEELEEYSESKRWVDVCKVRER